MASGAGVKPVPRKKPPGHTPKAVGRPRSIPAGAKPRTLRVTDAELAAVRALLTSLRAAAPAPATIAGSPRGWAHS
jgi:hypothetical protein